MFISVPFFHVIKEFHFGYHFNTKQINMEEDGLPGEKPKTHRPDYRKG